MPVDIWATNRSPPAAEVYFGSHLDTPGRFTRPSLSAYESHQEARRDDSQIGMQHHSQAKSLHLIHSIVGHRRHRLEARRHGTAFPGTISRCLQAPAGSIPSSSQVWSRLFSIS